ncbi:hypothetical protein SCATT_p00740 (plasmid) [Streptantibioticus cattleyicolor NRRL 8057 = DSM 46488]|uniref:Uncharacterized protein n=1 Tax=Streptantibioticus cattleyicolor (strain ATCC 35852 / DSM 46488 / JCM 4925 / NBRC 14057 / NRRL 8057) TaxID=1003195 RepID=G8XE03_STREN|nr:hypothetical protein SCATT_p00740 [Streptantibioticus cattleyicolor NRRL 8057 = DSM 46488]
MHTPVVSVRPAFEQCVEVSAADAARRVVTPRGGDTTRPLDSFQQPVVHVYQRTHNVYGDTHDFA